MTAGGGNRSGPAGDRSAGAGPRSGTTRDRIVAVLTDRFRPVHLEVVDDSARHAGHVGAASGGGHFQVAIVAAAFEGMTLLDQHRAVNEALRDLIGLEIHALGLKTAAPSVWRI
jgi:BolA protein